MRHIGMQARVFRHVSGFIGAFFLLSFIVSGTAWAGGNDEGRAILVDGQGNVYVCGKSWRSSDQQFGIVTVKYSASGGKQWAKRFTDIYDNSYWGQGSTALDGNGNLYITGQSLDRKVLILKYTTAGVKSLSKHQYSPCSASGSGSIGRAIHVTPNGAAIYVTGEGWNCTNSTWDVVTAKLSLHFGWKKLLSLAKHQFPFAMHVDASGKVYVTGQTYDSVAKKYDYITIKYNALGTVQWAKAYNHGSWDEPRSVAVDPSGNVYVTGMAGNAEVDRDFATVKYSPTGVQSPAWMYDGAAHALDYARTVRTDAHGNVYVAGSSAGAYNWDIVLIKYNSSGGQVWTRSFSNLCNDFFDEMVLDKDGNIYIAGHSGSGGSGSWDYVLLKYNPNGELLWSQFWNSTFGYTDVALAMTLDKDGNPHVTGKSYNGTDYDYITIKYNPSGVLQWARRYDSP